ncbi:LuxR C-terminal-related transcriptional regulator [Streptomyces carpaticus]|uniref:LuxR C-terminal-related transcriptional regulator n=1 Tax=Streptomyces carpaticus TaxID=285558 RepID=A0ABV4ZM35_9ACTN
MHDVEDIDATAVEVYLLRVRHPADDAERLAARAGLAAGDVARAEALLYGLGLLQPSPAGGWVAVSPESAADQLLAPVEADILSRRITMAAAREQLQSLSGAYVEARSMRSAEISIEVVEGIDNTRAVIDDLARTCTESLEALIPGIPSEEAIEAALPLDLELLARGAHIRTLLQHSARTHRAGLRYAETIRAAGARVRSAGVLPTRMLIYDRQCAVLPLDPLRTGAGVALVRDPSAVGFLYRVFDHCWDDGIDIPVTPGALEASEGVPTGLEREVLQLMAAGKANDAIAEQLGISRRSVSRVVSQLMTHLGATSRFQAGARAALNGWLS